MHERFDNQAALREARSRLPFERLLENYGHAPKNGKWTSFACPHCHKKSKAGLFKSDKGITMFKCQSTACPSKATAFDEVGYIAFVTGRSRPDAFVDYLKMAGVWKERERYQNGAVATERPAATIDAVSATSAIDCDDHLSQNEDDTPGGDESPSSDEHEPEEDLMELGTEASREALRGFYGQLTLTEEDQKRLLEVRAIESKVAVELGFKSNIQSNKEILIEAQKSFSMSVLVEAGLFVRQGQSHVPNKQFYGYGRVRRKKGDDGDEEWGWVQPVLIPYIDEDGELYHLRPHKGGIKGKPAHVYIPRTPGLRDDSKFPNVIVTEGEFKAAALSAILPQDWGVAALPGIQMAKNYGCREELEEWLRRVGAKRVVVVYDNENKSDPSLPGYKEEEQKRYDAHIWARLLAVSLNRRLLIRAEVGLIPAKYQDQNGKADWDGAMASISRNIAGGFQVV